MKWGWSIPMNNKKTACGIMIALLMIISYSYNACAKDSPKSFEGEYYLNVNGTFLSSSVDVYYNINGTLYFPLRKIAETLGYCVEWNERDETANLVQYEKLFPFLDEDNMLYGYMDLNKNVVIAPSYSYAAEFHDGRARTRDSKTKLSGYINAQGEIIIPYIYYSADDFSDGLAKVVLADSKNMKTGDVFFIDKNGNRAFERSFKEGQVGDFFSGYATVLLAGSAAPLTPRIETDTKWGYIKKDGSYVDGIVLESNSSFRNGYACVKKNGKWSIIDSNFNLMLGVEYETSESAWKAFYTYMPSYKNFQICVNREKKMKNDQILILNNRMYLDVNDLSQVLGLDVFWDEEHGLVHIRT